MNKNFREGDSVVVCMERNDCFPFQRSPRFPAKITYTPQASGDCWRFETEDGNAFLLNPQASDFIGLTYPDTTETEP